MRIGYNTNGFAHHDLDDALQLLAALGYESVALSIDHHVLNPFAAAFTFEMTRLSDLLASLGLRNVIETGARYLLNPVVKHEPTLVTRDAQERGRRVDFLCRAIDTAACLESDCVSIWSGTLHDEPTEEEAFDRLLPSLTRVLDYAAQHQVRVGLEPEPGMFIDTMDRYAELQTRLGRSDLWLTLDVGHLQCQGETPIPAVVREWAPRIVNVHIEDMRAGRHEHLQFGEGEIDFPPIISALRESNYQGGLHVELSRHGHEAPLAAGRAIAYLRPLVGPVQS